MSPKVHVPVYTHRASLTLTALTFFFRCAASCPLADACCSMWPTSAGLSVHAVTAPRSAAKMCASLASTKLCRPLSKTRQQTKLAI